MRPYRILISLSVLYGIILSSCSSHDPIDRTIVLDHNWFFKSVSDTTWMPASVPGTVHTDLISNNIIDDP